MEQNHQTRQPETSTPNQQKKKFKFDIKVNDSNAESLNDITASEAKNASDTIDLTSTDGGGSGRSNSRKTKRNRNKNKNKKSSAKTHQTSNKPVDIDYSQVDFTKFQGGSKANKSNPNEVQTKFHGKVIFLIII